MAASRVRYTLITGASSGIGRETAIRLSTSHKLILHGRDSARVEETRRSCVSAESHVAWILDFRDVDKIESALKTLLFDHSIAVENVVHCAGTLHIRALRSVELGEARETMDVNFISAVAILRLLVNRKINEKALRAIVFVSSTASQFGARGFNLYCASKGALDAFMRALAVELAPEVRVNSVLPGAVGTAMTEAILSDRDVAQKLSAQHPLGLGTPGDVAAAIDFLLSDAARWITGQQLVVDGGRTINITA